MEEKKNSKLYYSIKEVAERFNVPESTLRFWEKEFKQIKPKRAGRGIRQYTESDIRTIGMVHRLLVTEGLKIEAAKQKMSTRKDVVERHQDIKEKLLSIRKQLVMLRAEL